MRQRLGDLDSPDRFSETTPHQTASNPPLASAATDVEHLRTVALGQHQAYFFWKRSATFFSPLTLVLAAVAGRGFWARVAWGTQMSPRCNPHHADEADAQCMYRCADRARTAVLLGVPSDDVEGLFVTPSWTFDRGNEMSHVPGRLPIVYLKASCWRSSLCSGQTKTCGESY